MEQMRPSHRPSVQSQRCVVAIALFFLVCVGGAYAWFHCGEKERQITIRFALHPNIPGYKYRSEFISPNELSSLATTNLISGTFSGKNAGEIRVFFANWDDFNGKNLSVVQHTPDLCWVKAGWQPVDLGQPEKMTLQFGTTNLDFECRAFQAPGGTIRQLVIWATLVGGKPFQESWRFSTHPAADSHKAWIQADRSLAANQFFQSLINRVPAERSKQFVRCSTPIEGDWQKAFEILRTFGLKWIEVIPSQR